MAWATTDRRRLLVPLLLASAMTGCADKRPAAITVPPPRDEAIDFADLAIVLAAAVDADGRVDATALTVHLPRLERQLSQLSGPWPNSAGSATDATRLAWLYNARMAWSLRIVATGVQRASGRGDRFVLPATIEQHRLRQTPFVLDGRTHTLAEIDRRLGQYDDYRIPAAAPGAADVDGPMAQAPFAAETVIASLPERFDRYVRDENRLVIDHDAKRLAVPPALWRLAPGIRDEYNRRFGTAEASLATALAAAVGPRARDRLAEAQGYEVSPRTDPAGIVATPNP